MTPKGSFPPFRLSSIRDQVAALAPVHERAKASRVRLYRDRGRIPWARVAWSVAYSRVEEPSLKGWRLQTPDVELHTEAEIVAWIDANLPETVALVRRVLATIPADVETISTMTTPTQLGANLAGTNLTATKDDA